MMDVLLSFESNEELRHITRCKAFSEQKGIHMHVKKRFF